MALTQVAPTMPPHTDGSGTLTIRDIAAYAKLSSAEIEAIGAELDTIRSDIEASLGARDAAYIRRTIVFQRVLEVAARLLIAGTRSKGGLLAGMAALAYAKSVENMEIAHNVGHGQWDWMNDPEIHSTTWEWDMVGPSAQWRYSHNYHHHVFSNVLGVDDDLGFGILRMSRDQQWEPQHLVQPLRNVLLALIFEWGIALHDFYSARDRAATEDGKNDARQVLRAKIRRQLTKDYIVLPALSLRRWKRTLAANLGANVLRNLWAYLVIFCGHFPDGAERFGPETLKEESRGEWYLRQMLGAANVKAGPVLAFSSGNLCYQIEHHLFPDLPSNRLAEVSLRVRELCKKYDLPYTTGPLARQYMQTLRTIFVLALPDAGWRSMFGAASPA
jgi:NADPH-dependent stearoyl-CoA 9-desaturase